MKALTKEDIKSVFNDKATGKPRLYAPIGYEVNVDQINGNMALCSRPDKQQKFWAHLSQLQIKNS